MSSRHSLIALFALSLSFGCQAPPVAEKHTPTTAPHVADEPASADALRVLVVDGRTGEPVPGAVVEYVKNTLLTSEELEGYAERGFDADGLRSRVCARVATRHDGIAVLEDALVFEDTSSEPEFSWNDVILGVQARAGELWGLLAAPDARGEPARIVVEPDERAAVVVRDAHGHALEGVFVGLVHAPEYARSMAQPIPEDEDDVCGAALRWGGITGRDGRVEIAHLTALRRSATSAFEPGVIAGIRGPEDQPTLTRWNMAAGSTLEIVLPDCASIETLVVDENGQAIDDAQVELWFHSPDDPADASGFAPDSESGWYQPFRDGRALLGAVALDSVALVRASAPGRLPESVTVRTPSRSGETTRTTIQLADRSRVLTGRLVDAARHPLTGLSFDVLENESDADICTPAGAEQTQTDADGRFAVEIDWRDLGPGEVELAIVPGTFSRVDGSGVLTVFGELYRKSRTPVRVRIDSTAEPIDIGDIVVNVKQPKLSRSSTPHGH